MHCLSCNESDGLGCECECADCLKSIRAFFNKLPDLLWDIEQETEDEENAEKVIQRIYKLYLEGA